MKCRAILLAFLLFGAGFEVFSQQIIINEVMYHPLVTGLDTAQEWIELYNPGAAPVNLTGWRLTNGVEFAFTPGTTIQPGGYLVVCANVATFRSIYPSVANAVGPWLGSLSNNGES